MGLNNKRTSGLDLTALNAKMEALDQKAEKEKEVQQESADLKELVEELRLTIGDVRYLVPRVKELSLAIGETKDRLTKIKQEGDLAYTLFQCALAKANAEGIPIRADPDSLNAIIYQCNTVKDDIIDELKKSIETTFNNYISMHKLYLDELERHERTMLLSFQCDMDNALSRKGCWCTPRVFWWFFGIYMFCFMVTLLVIAFMVTGHLRYVSHVI
ncbi:MAG: hypothetical protein IKH01_04295 [Prevotella sp.]|nr:hypothetical protein [Prevotella sp.]